MGGHVICRQPLPVAELILSNQVKGMQQLDVSNWPRRLGADYGDTITNFTLMNRFRRDQTFLMGYTVRTDKWRYTCWFAVQKIDGVDEIAIEMNRIIGRALPHCPPLSCRVVASIGMRARDMVSADC